MIVAIIPAKGESSRLENKNLLEIHGKSLLARAIEYAQTSKNISKIYISTDDDRVERSAKAQDVEVIRRDDSLKEAPLIDVYRHALERIGDDSITHVVGIQPDHPDRKTNLDWAIQYAQEKEIDDLFTVDAIGVRNGALRILTMKAIQAAPTIYPSAIMDDCVNIHTPYDFYMAERNLVLKDDFIQVGDYKIGPNEPTFIIAEGACNHLCQMDLAYKMIDKAAESGASAIKFQTYKAEKLVTKDAVAFWGKEKISQIDYYRRLDRFGKREYEELFNYAAEKGIIGFSSPFDAESSDMLAEIGMPLFKIASCDIRDLMHLRRIARYGRPIILSTGASTLEEIEKAIMTIFEQGNYQLILLACTLSYPTKNEDANLLRIQTLKERFPGITIGLSDHTEPDPNMVIPAVAVSLGARVIEKHYTLDRSMTGSGHFFAVDPNDLKNMVQNIRLAETVMGDGSLGIAKTEQKAWHSARRSIVAEVEIKAGDIITEAMLGMKRPGDGLPGDMIDQIVGKRANQDINPDEKIYLEMIES